ncbi:MAG: hypothetical protein ACI865_001418 [Flavobacteriaceae bacterium]|jgi:hypothetical protein
MKALLILLILSLTSVSYAQINLNKLGGKAKEKTEKKIKDKAKEKADDALEEATRDPKAGPQPGEPLYDSYYRINKYIEEIENMADSRTSHGESVKSKVGTDMEQNIYLKSAQDNLDKAKEKQAHVDKKYKKAVDSIAQFNINNTDNKKGKARFETTFQEDLDAASTSFTAGNKFWIDKYQSELDRKQEIDAVLNRKHEIEKTISDEMSIHLSHLFRNYVGMSKDLHKYGEEFKAGAKELNWTQLDELIVEWSSVIDRWRVAMPADSKFLYDTPDAEEHLTVKLLSEKNLNDRKRLVMPEGKHFEDYKTWYADFVSTSVKAAIDELLFTSKNNYPENLNNQYVDAREAFYYGEGAVALFPSDGDLKSSKDNAQQHFDALVASLPGGAFHKENFTNVVFFNKHITPGSETKADIGNSWKFGQDLTGMYYLIDPVKHEFRWFDDEGGLGNIGFDLTSDNRLVKFNGIYVPLLNRKNKEVNYAHFDLFPNISTLTGHVGADYERHFENLKALPIGRYKFGLIRNPDHSAERKYTTTKSDEIEIEVTQEALDYFSKAYDKAHHARLSLVKPGKSKMSNASIVAAVKKGYADKKGTVLRVVITSSMWNISKNSFDIPKNKWVDIDVVYKDENGQCWLHNRGTVQREYSGAGSYGGAYYSHNYDSIEMLCGNAQK